MPVTRYSQIRAGLPVAIVLKADQRTGRQVQGTVAQLLTRHDHPRGIKVKLTDGRVGRVQQIVSASNPSANNTTTTTYPTSTPLSSRRTHNMANEQNPWQTSESQGNPYISSAGQQQQQQGQYQSYQQQQSQPPLPQRHPQHQAYSSQTPQQEAYSYNNPNDLLTNDHTDNYQGFAPPRGPPPGQGISRADTDQVLGNQPDRAEQYEHMQNYESQVTQTQDDKNQSQLQKEFPSIDSSLIAALYNDTKDLSATREMLQELNSGA